MAVKKVDKAMNVGRLVKLGSRDARVHELSWRSLRTVTKDLYDLALAIKRENPEIDFTKVSNAQAVEVIFNSMLSAVDVAGTVVEKLMADASDLEAAEVIELGISDFQKLLLAVLEEQEGAIDDFFALRAGMKKLAAPRTGPKIRNGKAG